MVPAFWPRCCGMSRPKGINGYDGSVGTATDPGAIGVAAAFRTSRRSGRRSCRPMTGRRRSGRPGAPIPCAVRAADHDSGSWPWIAHAAGVFRRPRRAAPPRRPLRRRFPTRSSSPTPSTANPRPNPSGTRTRKIRRTSRGWDRVDGSRPLTPERPWEPRIPLGPPRATLAGWESDSSGNPGRLGIDDQRVFCPRSVVSAAHRLPAKGLERRKQIPTTSTP